MFFGVGGALFDVAEGAVKAGGAELGGDDCGLRAEQGDAAFRFEDEGGADAFAAVLARDGYPSYGVAPVGSRVIAAGADGLVAVESDDVHRRVVKVVEFADETLFLDKDECAKKARLLGEDAGESGEAHVRR